MACRIQEIVTIGSGLGVLTRFPSAYAGVELPLLG